MYTRVESRFWQDETMRAVSDDARHLMLYLLTSPHRNILGLYYLPDSYACFDLGWVPKRFAKGLGELLRAGRVSYDPDAHVILLRNFLKYNGPQNQNQVTSGIEKLNELPVTPLMQEFLTLVEGLGKPLLEPLAQRLRERLGEPYAKQGIRNQESGIRNQESPPSPPLGGEGEGAHLGERQKRAKTQAEMFNAFWSTYPKKRSKGQAEKAWAKLKPDEQLVETIVAAIKRAKKSEQWQREDGRYIPYPATWLNAKGWEDEVVCNDTPVFEDLTERLERLAAEETWQKEEAKADNDDGGVPF